MGANLETRDKAMILQVNIIRMRRNYPSHTLRDIGERFGVTRERVRQVLAAAGKPTKGYHPPHLCLQCEKDVTVKANSFCSKECYHNYTRTLIPCIYCGQLGEYRIKELTWHLEHGQHSSNLFFCSKLCQGKWLAENYGFVKYPENRPLTPNPRKWDWSKVYELRDRTAWGAVKISRALGIPLSTVTAILAKRGA